MNHDTFLFLCAVGVLAFVVSALRYVFRDADPFTFSIHTGIALFIITLTVALMLTALVLHLHPVVCLTGAAVLVFGAVSLWLEDRAWHLPEPTLAPVRFCGRGSLVIVSRSSSDRTGVRCDRLHVGGALASAGSADLRRVAGGRR